VLTAAPGPYSYLAPPALLPSLRPGSRVLVPLGHQPRLEGVVLRLSQPASLDRPLKPIEQLVEGPPLPPELLELVDFAADYYLAPVGEALRLILPPHEQVELREQIRLTETGEALAQRLGQALLPAELAARSPVELAVLSALVARPIRTRKKGVDLAALRQQLKRATPSHSPSQVKSAVAELVGLELVQTTQTVAASVVARAEPWVQALPEAATEATLRQLERSPARASLWRHLLRFGPLPASELRMLSPRASQLVKQLKQLGAVAIEEGGQLSPEAARRARAAEAPVSILTAESAPPTLTAEQEQALAPMLAALGAGYHGFLLHGVTGSGKTELYLRLIAAALDAGKNAIVLVPEIALTPQLASRFVARFGPQVAVLHSALEPTERARAWRRILREHEHRRERDPEHGDVRIVLGPRSALFAPLANLGVVIVDEEHDGSFKQEDGVRYNGRDLSLVRAQKAGAVAVLGSATPSLETLALARRGKLGLLRLTQRATGMPLPKVEVIDLKQHVLPDDQALLSTPLTRAISETLGAGEQALLFLNRRGYSTFLLCKACGQRVECPHCSVTLTWHKARQVLVCHYCGHSRPHAEGATATCPVCQAAAVTLLGCGTEKLLEGIQARFPTARVARLDRDTSDDLDGVLRAMHGREIDVLIGTQMLAKGHDFPGVSLVGVVLADTGMGLPDFRASERTFQLLAQVAGRAGRQERPGRVLIQTYNPEHQAVICAAEHDYARFAEAELQVRSELGYVPAQRVGLLRIDGRDRQQVKAGAERLAKRLREDLARTRSDASLLGPAEAPLSRLKGRTRWQMLVRAEKSQVLRAVLRRGLQVPLGNGLRVTADVDPVSML
jgi:primosomal protein N' (replication factor Y)